MPARRKAAYQRALRLRKDGLVSDADVETARAAVADRPMAARIGSGMGGGGIALRAPVAGTVQNLTVKPGDQVAAGTSLATIGTRRRPARQVRGRSRARAQAPPGPADQDEHDRRRRTKPASTLWSGSIRIVDPTTRLASVYVAVPAGMGLGAGEPLRASLQVGATATGITIPYAALLDDGGKSFVFVVKGGVAKERDRVAGQFDGRPHPDPEGPAAPASKVVTEGGTALEDGMKVSEPTVGGRK